MQPSLVATEPSLIARECLRGAALRQGDVIIHRVGQTLVLAAELRNAYGDGDAWHYERSIRLELNMSHPPRATVDGVETDWSLEPSDTDDDPTERVTGWILAELWNEELVGQGFGVHDVPMEHPRYLDTKRRLVQLARAFRSRAIKLCDPMARALAITLDRSAQVFAYTALISDPTGRVRQSIDTCPGLWTLAPALSTDAAARFVAAVREGERLSVLITGILELAAQGHTRTAAVLLRRAPRLPSQHLVRVLHAPAVDINDIPNPLPERRAWYRTIVAWSSAWRRIGNLDIVQLLGAYISKHAVVYAADPDQAISELIDWIVRGGNRTPCRASSPARVRATVERWHEQIGYMDIDASIELPRGPASLHMPAGIDVTQILTVGELLAETRAMHHCVVSMAEEARLGWLFIYRGVVNSTRATIAIAPACDGTWLLHEAKGIANIRLDDHAHSMIDAWLAGLICGPRD